MINVEKQHQQGWTLPQTWPTIFVPLRDSDWIFLILLVSSLSSFIFLKFVGLGFVIPPNCRLTEIVGR